MGEDHKKFDGFWSKGDAKGTSKAVFDSTWEGVKDKVKEGYKKTKEEVTKRLKGKNGVWWALGGIAVVGAIGTGVYCMCCKKDKDMMAQENAEGGESYSAL